MAVKKSLSRIAAGLSLAAISALAAWGLVRWADPMGLVQDSPPALSEKEQDRLVNQRRQGLRQLLRENPQATCPAIPSPSLKGKTVVLLAEPLSRGIAPTKDVFTAVYGLNGLKTLLPMDTPQARDWALGGKSWPRNPVLFRGENPRFVLLGRLALKNSQLHLIPQKALPFFHETDAYPVICEAMGRKS